VGEGHIFSIRHDRQHRTPDPSQWDPEGPRVCPIHHARRSAPCRFGNEYAFFLTSDSQRIGNRIIGVELLDVYLKKGNKTYEPDDDFYQDAVDEVADLAYVKYPRRSPGHGDESIPEPTTPPTPPPSPVPPPPPLDRFRPPRRDEAAERDDGRGRTEARDDRRRDRDKDRDRDRSRDRPRDWDRRRDRDFDRRRGRDESPDSYRHGRHRR
jgi:hypothetical protein